MDTSFSTYLGFWQVCSFFLNGLMRCDSVCNLCVVGGACVLCGLLVMLINSDLGVLYTWYVDDTWRHLAYISTFVMINYRVFSSLTLWRAQRGWRDILLQCCDFQLFVDVYRSSVTLHVTDTLYWIRTMEGILESFPQILLSFVFLYDSEDLFVFISLLGSLISIVISLIHYTDVVFVFRGTKAIIVFCIRFSFRLCEVLGRAMLLALIWYEIIFLFIYLFISFICLFAFVAKF